jgi:hypothetical protein
MGKLGGIRCARTGACTDIPPLACTPENAPEISAALKSARWSRKSTEAPWIGTADWESTVSAPMSQLQRPIIHRRACRRKPTPPKATLSAPPRNGAMACERGFRDRGAYKILGNNHLACSSDKIRVLIQALHVCTLVSAR